mgnify:CR=1 FL=1
MTTPSIPDLIAALEEHDAAMTSGPWNPWRPTINAATYGVLGRFRGETDCLVAQQMTEGSAAGIAWFGTHRGALVEALREVERLRVEVERLRTENNGHRADALLSKRDEQHLRGLLGEARDHIPPTVEAGTCTDPHCGEDMWEHRYTLTEATHPMRMRIDAGGPVAEADCEVMRDAAMRGKRASDRLRADRDRLAAEVERLTRDNADLADALRVANRFHAEAVDKMWMGKRLHEQAGAIADEQIAEARTERDAAIAARDSAANDTAERIAAWLDAKSIEHGKHGHGLIEYLALHLRAGAWRGQNGGSNV